MASDPLIGVGAMTAPLSSANPANPRTHPSAEMRQGSVQPSTNGRSDAVYELNGRIAQRSETESPTGQTEESRRDPGQGVLVSDQEMVDRLSEAVDKINEMLQQGRQMLTFQLDEDSERMVIRVIDAQTNEVIRQIPSEETLNFAKYVDGLIGLIFNKKA